MFGLDDMAAATLIGSGVNFLGGLFSNSSNADTNKENREWQSHENELSRKFQQGENSLDRGMLNYWNQRSLDWQEKMWNLQNQYNTPSAMMARYKEAGLNPYLNGLSQLGSGAGSAGSAGSPSIGTSPAGSSAPLSGSPSSIPMVAPHLDLAGALGVSSSIANQNADTLRKKWDIYNSILENGDRQTAKRFLGANPDMMSDADPENSLFFKKYQAGVNRDILENEQKNFEYNLRQMYGVKQAELELYKLKNESDNLISLISKRKVEEKELEASIKKINEQIRTEKSVQTRNYSEAGLASAKAQTENQSRMYVIRQLLLGTNMLEFDENTARSIFESEDSVRGWLTSREGKEFILAAKRTGVGVNTDYLLRAIYGILGNSGVHAGVNAGVVNSTSTIYK